MTQYIKNEAFEIIDDEESIILFDKDMTIIYSMDYIGKIILECFYEGQDLETLEVRLSQQISNIDTTELSEFTNWLIEKQIIIPTSKQ